jgi:hypothetical protein
VTSAAVAVDPFSWTMMYVWPAETAVSMPELVTVAIWVL